MKVLIAEDDLTCRILLQELLKDYAQPHIAVNGREALEAVRMALVDKEPYDLICLDIMMPEMDGQQALREIRAIEEANGIFSSEGSKIIMITVMADMKNISAAYMNLCDAYLAKPIEKPALIEQLRLMNLIP